MAAISTVWVVYKKVLQGSKGELASTSALFVVGLQPEYPSLLSKSSQCNSLRHSTLNCCATPTRKRLQCTRRSPRLERSYCGLIQAVPGY